MKRAIVVLRLLLTLSISLLPCLQTNGMGAGKIDCSPVTNKSNDLPRIAAIGTNPAGTGAHAIAASLAALGSKATPIGVRVQPYNGPKWMPLVKWRLTRHHEYP